MAKRAPARDRNTVAKLKAQRAAMKDEWAAKDGRIIKLKKAELMYIQMASSSVEMPEPPMYTVQVGKASREYPVDQTVIDQTEDPAEKLRLSMLYRNYLHDLGTAYSEIARRSTAAVFLEGTVVDDEMIDNDENWRRRMKIMGWPVPRDPEERWVLYLQTSLSEKEIEDLSTKVATFSSGVSEEVIRGAEATFPDTVPTDIESGDVEDAE